MMRPVFNLLLIGFSIALIPKGMNAQPCMELIWSDEFDGTELDTELWNYDIGDGCPDLCGWGNNEQQYYSDSPENISVADGILTITGKEDTLGGLEYSSAKITSFGKGEFKYGRFEARMRFPQTQGVWPAFWMLPADNVYGVWPQSGEIDIVEMIGANPGQAVGTIHTGFPYAYTSGYYDLPPGQIFADNFHVFSVEWEPESITWFVDGIQYHELTPDDIGPWAPFQEEFYLILNLALGGNWPGPVDETTDLPQTLEVDYVRVYNSPDRLSIQGDQPIVEAVGIEYSTYAIEGANYIWTVPDDAVITSGQGTNQITVDWGCTVGNVELELQTDCDDAFLSYDVEGFVEPTISGETTVDLNQAGITYSIPQATAANLTWEVPEGAVIVSGQGTNEIVVDWGCESGEVMVSLNGSCDDAFSLALPVEIQTYAVLGQPSLPPNTNRTYSIDELLGATYSWTVSSGASIVSGQGTNSVEINFGTIDVDITVTVETSCGTNTYDFAVAIEESFIYADFDNVDMDFVPRHGAVWLEVANPSPSGINTSELVGRINKTIGAQSYAGIEVSVNEIPIDLRPIMTHKVYSNVSGIVRFVIDDLTTGFEKLNIDVLYGPNDINQWVQLVYDFTDTPTEVYDEIGMRFNFGSLTTEFWYFDDVMNTTDAFLSSGTGTENKLTEAISVYPNPSSGQFALDTKDIFPAGSIYEFEVLDNQGRSVLSQKVFQEGQPVEFDLSDQPSGLYIVRLSGNMLRYVKVIKL
jgi:beta-glucanase (GH16 family)